MTRSPPTPALDALAHRHDLAGDLEARHVAAPGGGG